MSVAAGASLMQLHAANAPPIPQTKDVVSARAGLLRGGSTYTPDGGGHTGAPGDYGIDFKATGSGPIVVTDGTFFNTAAANDEITVALWAKKYDIAAGSAFWAISPSSNNGQLGYQAHIPWDNNNIYFDSAGCCNPDTRLNASITTFPPYQAVGNNTWWQDWHFYVFSKKGPNKQIWIDGQLFLQGNAAARLPQDFTQLMIGSDNAGGSLFHAIIDDFTVFAKQLRDENIQAIYSGTLPTELDPGLGLLAYWNFNDYPAAGLFTSVLPAPGATATMPNQIQVVHVDGDTPWTEDNIVLKVDGTPVTPTFDKVGNQATVSYLPSPLFKAQSAHTASIIYPVTGQQKTSDWSFVVAPYTLDTVASRLGALTGGSLFTPNAGGHTGAAGDYAIDFGRAASGPVYVETGNFLNAATAEDGITIAFWVKRYDIANSSSFWANSPSSSGTQRGIQAHTPSSDNVIYYDSSGCCGGTQRINANISTFPLYSGDLSWWNDWHHILFQIKLGHKEIWIDGQLFLQGDGFNPLPTDFTTLYIGSDGAGGNVLHGLIDDFSVFSTQLVQDDIQALYAGALPPDLDPSTGLLAYWNFNDVPADGLFLSLLPTPGDLNAGPNLVQAVHRPGPTPWDLDQVTLRIDGVVVAADKVLSAGKVTVSYVPNPIFAKQSGHVASLTYPSSGGGLLAKEWAFTVGVYTKDVLHRYVGLLTGAAAYTPDAGGHSGLAGDYAIDFGPIQAGQGVHVLDATFLNAATANDELAVCGWQRLHSVANSGFVWGVSPSSGGGQRGWGTHSPWDNNDIYFDSAGCCGLDTRLSANISTFPGYTGDSSWWNDWHHILFQKKQDHKEIWIDGQLFLQGDGFNPLPSDFTDAYFGADPVDNARLQGILDDMAIFSKALDGSSIGDLAAGALPTALPAWMGLIAYWNFNDPPTGPVFLSIRRDDATHLVLSWTGGKAPFQLQRKASLTDPLWEEVLVTDTPSATIIIQGARGFFRVVERVTP